MRPEVRTPFPKYAARSEISKALTKRIPWKREDCHSRLAMNAGPLLNSLVAALAEVRLDAILIGNAAAAIHGAPVTTVDFDFMFGHGLRPPLSVCAR